MNSIGNSRGVSILIIGDLVVYVFSLILSLIIRYGDVPTRNLFMSHIEYFFILFIVFLVVSFSAGLYDKQTTIIRNKIQGLILRTQILNLILGITFFYFIPAGINPKTNLLIYIAVSTVILLIWRMIMFPIFNMARNQSAILVGSGDDIQDVYEEINGSTHYGIFFNKQIQPKGNTNEIVDIISEAVKSSKATILVVDLHDKSIELAMPFLYNLIFSGVQIIDASKLYESLFDRVPLSMVGERWFIENSSSAFGNRRTFDLLKRSMDIFLATLVGFIYVVVYPFIWLSIKLEDRGLVFIFQERIGKNGKIIQIIKFRSMTANDSGNYNNNDGRTILKVTKTGKFTRMTRLDELPQIWSVLKGDQSLIGPRPELPALVSIYEKEIPYYNARHLIKPGLSGWAQIYHSKHPHHGVSVDDTRDKLSYDLYYIKHRSLLLDLRIALQTLKVIISKQGA